MAYELANYYGGRRPATAKQLAALEKARAAKKAGKVPKNPPFEYSGETENKRKCRKNPAVNPNRSAYLGCKLRVLHKVPCEYRTKENMKALTNWATQYCPPKQRKKVITVAQLREDAVKAGIELERVNAKGKRVAKTKAMLLEELNFRKE